MMKVYFILELGFPLQEAPDLAYFYAAVWLAVGLILIARMGKENRVFYLLGGFFLFLGVWWTAGTLTGINLFVGTWVWILRGVTSAVLAAALVVFFRQLRKDRENFKRGANGK